MADLTRDDVLHLAKLARLEFSDTEIDELQKELASILGYVEQLKNVDVKGLTPSTQVTELHNVFRDDVIVDYESKAQDLLNLTPEHQQDGHIKVKRMVQ